MSDDPDQKRPIYQLAKQVRERTNQLELLHDIAIVANESRSAERVIGYCLRRVSENQGWPCSHAYLEAEDDSDELVVASAWYSSPGGRFDSFCEAFADTRLRSGQGLPGRVRASGRPASTSDLAEELTDRQIPFAGRLALDSALAIPILVGKRVVGVLEFFSDEPMELDPALVGSITSVGAQVGFAVEREALLEQLRKVADDEQMRIARDLHDAIGQEMAGITMMADRLHRRLRRRGTSEARSMETILEGLRRCLENVRQLARGLSRIGEGPGELAEALEFLAHETRKQWNVECVVGENLARTHLNSEVGTHLYRIAQEAVRNSVRHGSPERIEIRLQESAQTISLQIKDDGVGMPPHSGRVGIGLRTMRQRARIIGGTLTILPSKPNGTEVKCTLQKETDHEE